MTVATRKGIKSRKSSPDDFSNAVSPSKPLEATSTVKRAHFEFGGPIGAAGIVFGLPVVVLGLFYICNRDMCLFSPYDFDWNAFWQSLPTSINQLVSIEALLMYFGWMGFHVFLERVLPGEDATGVKLPDGQHLVYRMSGHLQFWITLAVLKYTYPIFVVDKETGVFSVSDFQSLRLEYVYDHYVQLIFVSTVAAYALSLYLYWRSFAPNVILAKGGNTGYAFYDFFMGRELNPRIGSLDLKEFCELRPGLIGWTVLNLGMASKQFLGNGAISISMLLICLFQGFYVWDALYMEKAILTTMDITTDGFGFMLAFGDLVWVPFIYSLQARYLVDYDPQLSLAEIAIISGIHFFGYFIFRSANSEKDAFRKDPSSPEVSHLTFLETKRGTRLLTSGWWGAARKINYTGDWLVTFSWCLLCGWKSPIPYFQAVYFLILLVHRAQRDDEMCAEKYGGDWIEYKKRVPYVFIPYVV